MQWPSPKSRFCTQRVYPPGEARTRFSTANGSLAAKPRRGPNGVGRCNWASHAAKASEDVCAPAMEVMRAQRFFGRKGWNKSKPVQRPGLDGQISPARSHNGV